MSPTEILLKKKFGITNFDQVILKLNGIPEEVFTKELLTDKDIFIKKIIALDNEICQLYSTYSIALDWMKSGSIYESFTKYHFGALRIAYIKARKQMVHHLSYFYSLKK